MNSHYAQSRAERFIYAVLDVVMGAIGVVVLIVFVVLLLPFWILRRDK